MLNLHRRISSIILPSAHRDLNRQNVSHLDKIFEIVYTDSENDTLYFEYVYTDVDTNLNTTYFLGDPMGNTFSK